MYFFLKNAIYKSEFKKIKYPLLGFFLLLPGVQDKFVYLEFI